MNILKLIHSLPRIPDTLIILLLIFTGLLIYGLPDLMLWIFAKHYLLGIQVAAIILCLYSFLGLCILGLWVYQLSLDTDQMTLTETKQD